MIYSEVVLMTKRIFIFSCKFMFWTDLQDACGKLIITSTKLRIFTESRVYVALNIIKIVHCGINNSVRRLKCIFVEKNSRNDREVKKKKYTKSNLHGGIRKYLIIFIKENLLTGSAELCCREVFC